MSDLSRLITADQNSRAATESFSNPGSLFKDATWDQVGSNKELTDFLHRSIDPNGSKFGGDTDALKTELLNEQTRRGSSAIASVWDAMTSGGENVNKKQFENLVGRLYESAPNRLASGNFGDTYEAVKSGLVGGVVLDLPLNVLFGAGALGKIGIGGGTKALQTAGGAIVKEGAERLSQSALENAGEAALKSSADDIGSAAVQELGRMGRNQGALVEGIAGAVSGGVGDLAQQSAAVDRGLQEEVSFGNAALNTAGGALLGSVFGGVGGYFEGRGVGKEVAGLLPSATASRFLEKAADTMGGTPPTDPSMVTLADAYRKAQANSNEVGASLIEFRNNLTGGLAESNYTPEEVDALLNAVSKLGGSEQIIEATMKQANALIAQGTPESITAGRRLAAQAASQQRFLKMLDTLGLDDSSDAIFRNVNGKFDIRPEIMDGVTAFDEELAAVRGMSKEPPAPTAAKGSKASPPSAPSAGSPGAPATSGVAGVAPTPGAAVAQATDEAAAKAASDLQATKAQESKPDVATAEEVTAMAGSVFTPDEKKAFDDISASAGLAGIDLQTALDGLRGDAPAETVANIAKASGQDRAKVNADLEKVASAAEREKAKQAPPATEVATAAPAATTVADDAASTAGDADPTADRLANIEALQAKINAENDAIEASKRAASAEHASILQAADTSVQNVSDVLDGILRDIDEQMRADIATFGEAVEKMAKEEKVAIAQAALDRAVAADPDMAPILARLDAEKLTSEAGVAKAKIAVKQMAQDGVSFTYAMVVGDALPDRLNTEDFAVVLNSMLEQVPAEQVSRIISDYKKMVYNALVERIRAVGVENVQKDAKLGPAYQRLVNGDGGFQKFGGRSVAITEMLANDKRIANLDSAIEAAKAKGDSTLVKQLEDRKAQRIAAASRVSERDIVDSQMRAVLAQLPDEQGGIALAGHMNNIKKSVSDFKKQLVASGIPADSTMLTDALYHRALQAVYDVVNQTFEKENAGAFAELAKQRAFREEEKAGTLYKRTSINSANPFLRGFHENPVLQRVLETDEDGNNVLRDMIVSGRVRQEKIGASGEVTITDKDGKVISIAPGKDARFGKERVQGMLSNGTSGTLGVVWNSPRKMFGSYAAAYNSIYGAGILNSSNQAGSMMIDGKLVKGSMSYLKGIYKENLIERREHARMLNILDAVERLRAPDTVMVDGKEVANTRKLTLDQYKARIASISDMARPVTDSEVYMVSQLLEYQERIRNTKVATQATMREILAESKTLGIRGSEQINALVGKLNAFKHDNENRLLSVINEYQTKAQQEATTRSKTTKVKDKDGKVVGSRTEGTETGTAESIKTRERNEADASVSGSMTVSKYPDGKFAPIKPSKRDVSPVILKIGGVSYEVIPSKIISLKSDGTVTLFGKQIGTWAEGTKNGRSVILKVPGFDGEEINDLTAMTRKSLVKSFEADFKNNADKLVKAKTEVADALPEGSQIDVGVSATAKVDEAQDILIRGKASDNQMSTPMNAFKDIPSDRMVVIKDKSTGYIHKAGKENMGMTIAEYAAARKIKPENIEIGTVLAGNIGKTGELKNLTSQQWFGNPANYRVLGSDTGTVNQKIVKKIAENKESAPGVLKAQRMSISVTDARSIKVDDKRTLADVFQRHMEITAQLNLHNFNKAGFQKILDEMKETTELLESLAPHGVMMDNASRRVSFSGLQANMAKYTEEERNFVLDLLRRIDPDANNMPYFYAAADDGGFAVSHGNGDNLGSLKVRVPTTPSKKASVPSMVPMAHEIGHWAFKSILTPSEQLEYMTSLLQYFDDGGRLNIAKLMASMPGRAQMAGGVDRIKPAALNWAGGVNELFAEQYSAHVFQVTVGKNQVEGMNNLWQKLTKIMKNVLQYFMNHEIDSDLAPLFERILPSTLSETKYIYNNKLYDRSTGSYITPDGADTKQRKSGFAALDMMKRIDTLRSNIGVHMFTAGGVDGGFAEDLALATKHMFGLLYGNDTGYFTDRLRTSLRSGTKRPMTKPEALAAGFVDSRGNGDPYMRDSKGKVLKDASGAGVLRTVDRPGAIDPATLFSRTDTGEVMSKIFEITPKDAKADNVALQAAQTIAEFEALVVDTSIYSDPFAMLQFKRTMTAEYERLLKSGMKPEDAMDGAEIIALKEAAGIGKDVENALFKSDGTRHILGSAQQQAAINKLARSMYDLMGDAMDKLATEINRVGMDIKKNVRVVINDEMDAAGKAADAAIAKAKKPKPEKPKQAPASEKATAVTKQEEQDDLGVTKNGVPANAPDQWKALIARAPHRDPKQNDIIGRFLYRLMSHITEDGRDVTNADLALLMNAKLPDGFLPESPASDKSPAFESLRKVARHVSELMTNPDADSSMARTLVETMMANARLESITQTAGENVKLKDVADALKAISGGNQAQIKKAMKDGNLSSVSDMLEQLSGDIDQIMSGLGATASAKVTTGTTMATPGAMPSVKFSDGTYHPSFAKAAIEQRLANLPQKIADGIRERMGVSKDTPLQDLVGFMAPGSRKIYSRVEDMTIALLESDERVAQLDAELAKALNDSNANLVASLKAKREALLNVIGYEGDGVQPVFFRLGLVYDQQTATDLQIEQLAKAMETGEFKKEADALKALGWHGVVKDDHIAPFSNTVFKDFEAVIKYVSELKRNKDAGDTPLVGELILNYGAYDEPYVDPLGVEQRSLQQGAPGPVAKIMSKMFKKNKSENGLTAEESMIVRVFHGLQLSDNATRIRNAGGKWLGDAIAPVEGTGFNEALFTQMSTSLVPMITKLDKMTGQEFWLKKSAREIQRNLDMRGYAVPQSESETRMVMAMRSGDISKLSMEERAYVADVKRHFKNLLQLQNDADIRVADITDGTNDFYLPQRFNLAWINENKDEAVKLLGDYFANDRKGTLSAAKAHEDARRVIMEAINREELQGIIDSSSSSYIQAFGDKLHQRKLRIVGKDWEAMAPMFDNNLRSLMTTYTDAAIKRTEWSKRFGIRGHGSATYVDIANKGVEAVIQALQGKANGMKYSVTARDIGDAVDAANVDQRSVEFTESLFSPMAKNEYEAAAVASHLVTALKADSSDAARQRLIDNLVSQFEAGGGFGVDHFRKRAEAIVNGLADFGPDGKTVANHEMDFMLKMIGTLGGRPAYTTSANQGLRQAAGYVKMFNSVTLLSGAVAASMTDPVMSLIRSGSVKSWLKGNASAVKLAMRDPAYAEAMMRVGVTMESILNENITHVNGGAAGRISNAFFQANMLTPWTNAQRQVAALVGFESIKANQVIAQREIFNGTTDSWAYRKSMRYLRQLGLAELANGKALNDFPSAVENIKVAEAIHKFTNESVFQPNRNDMPLWTQDPIAGILWQFKSYPTMMGRLVKKQFKDAVAMEDGKYAGDPMGLLYLMTIGGAAGAGTLALKDVAFGKNNEPGTDKDEWRSVRERTLSKIVQELGFKDFDLNSPMADAILGNYAQGMLQIGSLGMLGDLMFQSAKSVDNGAFGRERIMSQIGGPTIGLFSDTIQVVDGLRDGLSSEEGFGSGSSIQRNAARKVVSRVPFAGGQSPWVETFVDNVAGEAQTEPRSY